MAESIDLIDATRKMIASHISEVNTCLPGVIVSYANGRAGVLPSASKRFSDGDVLPFPIVQNVRVCWPSFAGGAAGVKGPVRPGDRCLLVFAQQAVDGTDDMRRHDLSDAYAIMCDLGTAGAGDSGNNDDLTLFFGSSHIRITEGGDVEINAGTINMIGDVVHTSGTIVSLGRKIDGTHTHGGILPGGSNTAVPNA